MTEEDRSPDLPEESQTEEPPAPDTDGVEAPPPPDEAAPMDRSSTVQVDPAAPSAEPVDESEEN